MTTAAAGDGIPRKRMQDVLTEILDATSARARGWWDALRRGLATPGAPAARGRQDVIRDTWREVVRENGLAETVYWPAGPFRVEARITRVVLGTPERFTVQLGTGQVFEDIGNAETVARIAEAFGVPWVRVTGLPCHRLQVELFTVRPS